jgi:hypothetical protein
VLQNKARAAKQNVSDRQSAGKHRGLPQVLERQLEEGSCQLASRAQAQPQVLSVRKASPHK